MKHKYDIALGQYFPDAEGRRQQSIIIYDERGREVLRVKYDEAAESLLKAFPPRTAPVEWPAIGSRHVAKKQ